MNDEAHAAKTTTGKELAIGFFIAVGIHAIVAVVAWVLIVAGLFILIIPALNPGATQVAYLLPLFLYYRRRNEGGKARGVLIAMALTVLLNGLCWVALETGKFRIGG